MDDEYSILGIIIAASAGVWCTTIALVMLKLLGLEISWAETFYPVFLGLLLSFAFGIYLLFIVIVAKFVNFIRSI